MKWKKDMFINPIKIFKTNYDSHVNSPNEIIIHCIVNSFL